MEEVLRFIDIKPTCGSRAQLLFFGLNTRLDCRLPLSLELSQEAR